MNLSEHFIKNEHDYRTKYMYDFQSNPIWQPHSHNIYSGAAVFLQCVQNATCHRVQPGCHYKWIGGGGQVTAASMWALALVHSCEGACSGWTQVKGEMVGNEARVKGMRTAGRGGSSSTNILTIFLALIHLPGATRTYTITLMAQAWVEPLR